MSQRAAEMAQIMMEEWPEGESAEIFALRRFPKDTLKDLEKAAEIMAELENADEVADDWFTRGKGAAIK